MIIKLNHSTVLLQIQNTTLIYNSRIVKGEMSCYIGHQNCCNGTIQALPKENIYLSLT